MLSTRITILVAATLVLPLVSGWGNDAIQEPSSKHDQPRYMWQTPNDRSQVVGGQMPDRLYFNGQLSFSFVSRHVNAPDGRLAAPTLVHADALLGYWRDCNNDGYIGNAVTGQKNYFHVTSPTSIDTNVCPVGSIFWPNQEPLAPNTPYNRLCCMVHEFVDVGPYTEFPQCGERAALPRCAPWGLQDDGARVWADFGLPQQPRTRYLGFRDPIAEPTPVLPFQRGTFDSWNGHIAFIDGVTSGRVASTYQFATGQSVYDTPLAGNDPQTPLYSVRYTGYSKGSPDNGWSERPMVRTWRCDPGNPEPQLQPGLDPDGAVVDSANHTFMGARRHVVVPNPFGGDVVNAKLYIGPGCDGRVGEQTFNDGLFLTHPEDPEIPTEEKKVAPDFFFQYRPPLTEPRNQMAAWGVVPRADRTTGGTWYAHQMYFSNGPLDRGAQYYTFYGKVTGQGLTSSNWPGSPPQANYPSFTAPGARALPGATVFNGQHVPPTYRYGEEACTSPGQNGWECANWPAGPFPAWEKYRHHWWGVVLGETYQLRDVDCTDLTVTAPAETKAAKDVANMAWNEVVGDELLGEPLFPSVCE